MRSVCMRLGSKHLDDLAVRIVIFLGGICLSGTEDTCRGFKGAGAPACTHGQTGFQVEEVLSVSHSRFCSLKEWVWVVERHLKDVLSMCITSFRVSREDFG